MEWKRIKEQENLIVYRWFECKDIIASVVKGYFLSEWNIRISSDKWTLPEIRGHKSIIEQLTDESFLEIVERAIINR